jgi:hypothetical protein
MEINIDETGVMTVDNEVKTDEDIALLVEKLTRARETARDVSKRYETIKSILKKHQEGKQNE